MMRWGAFSNPTPVATPDNTVLRFRMTDRDQPTNRPTDMVQGAHLILCSFIENMQFSGLYQSAGDRSCPLAVSGIRTLTPKEMPQKSIILIKKNFRVPRKQTYVINKEAENGQVQDDSAAVS